MHVETATYDIRRPFSSLILYFDVFPNNIFLVEQVLQAHLDEVWFLQFSNNGKYLASSSSDRSAIIWEVNFFSFRLKTDSDRCFGALIIWEVRIT